MMHRMFRFLTYALVGLVGTAVQYLVLIVLTSSGTTNAVLASTVGACIGAGVNYVLNYRFTFRSEGRHTRTASRFLCVAVACTAINAAVMGALLSRLHMQYLVAQCVSTAFVLVTGFLLNTLWSFRAVLPE